LELNRHGIYLWARGREKHYGDTVSPLFDSQHTKTGCGKIEDEVGGFGI
jgi:hypothetical protein